MVLQSSSKRLIIWAAAILGLLMIPFFAMQFTSEVNWEVSDFLVMGSILLALALAYELIARRSKKVGYKTAFGVGLLGAFLLFWVNGAVGIIGNEGQPANYLYTAPIIVIMGGSVISGFKAGGMARTLFIAAAVQMLIPVIALLIWPPPETSWSPSIFGVFLLTGFFSWLFLVSGILFKRASKQ